MSSVARADLCNLDDFYANGFSYPVKREIMESYFDGKAFDNPVSYTGEERAALIQDIYMIHEQVSFVARSKEKPVAVISAGAPGAGKTLLMRAMLQGQESQDAYIDPDDVC